MNKLDKLSIFNVSSSFTLSSDDIYSLTLLYEPLIGSEALSLYLLFNSLLERSNLLSQELTHIDFFDLSALNEKVFYNSRLRLEAIGLLSSYTNDNKYFYLLKAPLTPKQFLTDGTLGLYLHSKIGPKMFEYLIEKFRITKIEKNDYQNITVSFDDVFTTDTAEYKINKNDTYLLGKKPNQAIFIKNNEFDFNEFLNNIDVGLLEYGVTEHFKRQITNIAYTYNFDEGDIESLFPQSINKRGFFDYRLFKKQASAFYQYKYDKSKPSLEIKDYSAENDVISVMSKISGVGLLSMHNPNYTADDLNLINRIYDEIKLPHVVLNFMLFSLLNEMSGEVLPFSYYKKTADTWIFKGIVDGQKAYDYIMKLEKPQIAKKPPGYQPVNKEKSTEQWVKDYINNIKEGLETL